MGIYLNNFLLQTLSLALLFHYCFRAQIRSNYKLFNNTILRSVSLSSHSVISWRNMLCVKTHSVLRVSHVWYGRLNHASICVLVIPSHTDFRVGNCFDQWGISKHTAVRHLPWGPCILWRTPWRLNCMICWKFKLFYRELWKTTLNNNRKKGHMKNWDQRLSFYLNIDTKVTGQLQVEQNKCWPNLESTWQL